MTNTLSTEKINGMPRIYVKAPQDLLDRLEHVLAAKLPELRHTSDRIVWAIRQTVEREEYEQANLPGKE